MITEKKSEFPIYNLNSIANIERYIIPYVSSRTISLYTSQGCPFGCKFCAINSVYGSRYSGWKIEEVVDLVEDCVKKYCIDGVHFDDDNFFIKKERGLEFAKGLLERNIKINWSSDARVDVLCNMTEEEWQILDSSGCKRLLVGAESGSQATLDKLNKRITPEMIIEFGSLCQKYNIIPSFSMMVGVPEETKDEIEETFKLLEVLKQKVPASQLLLFLYTPYPGTPLYDLAKKNGFEEPSSLEDWGEFYLNVPTVPWIDESLIKRVKKSMEYFSSFKESQDISLKNNKDSLNLRKMYFKAKNLLYRFNNKKDKKKALLDFLKRKIHNQ